MSVKNELPTIKDIVLNSRKNRAKRIKNRKERTQEFRNKITELAKDEEYEEGELNDN